MYKHECNFPFGSGSLPATIVFEVKLREGVNYIDVADVFVPSLGAATGRGEIRAALFAWANDHHRLNSQAIRAAMLSALNK